MQIISARKFYELRGGAQIPSGGYGVFTHEPASRNAAESGLSPAPTVIVRMEEAGTPAWSAVLFRPFTPRCVEVFFMNTTNVRRLVIAAMCIALSVALIAVIHLPIIPAAAWLEYDPADIPLMLL